MLGPASSKWKTGTKLGLSLAKMKIATVITLGWYPQGKILPTALIENETILLTPRCLTCIFKTTKFLACMFSCSVYHEDQAST